ECAEAQSKDVGVIATERGWNLYVGGNGGMRPAHAELLAEDLDDAALVRAIDRYLMWYVRSAERLERTATWQRKLPGGIEFVRRVVIDDALGLGDSLEADMSRHVAGYRCEWTETLADPVRMERFTTGTAVAIRCADRKLSSGPGWSAVRSVARLTPNRGVAASVDGVDVAVFLLADGTLHAIDNVDPISGTSILSRGLIGDIDGTATVASPMYKQRFELGSGSCVDVPGVAVRVHDVVLDRGWVHVRLATAR
ncbi:MAG: nirb1, partial [Ilumatobacteraceae bacterium]|nr:nirb1 [Ilumatobacteraceae bacterium]